MAPINPASNACEPLAMNDHELLRAFEDCTLPFDQWTHRCHVKVAYAYLRRYSYDEALAKMRAGIKRYNAANGVPDTPTTGYNETTTQGFFRLIAATIGAFEEVFPTDNADAFCDLHPQLMTRFALRFFYSPARRGDPLGKTELLEPDLASLPAVPK